MKKIFEVKCYWTLIGDFNERNSWNGKVLLDEDNWAEGIVNDPYSPYTGERLVFGPCVPNEFAELCKVSPSEVSDPQVFKYTNQDGEYLGEFDVVSYTGQRPFGECKLELTELELTPEEIAEFEKTLTVCKETLLSGNNIDFYVNTAAIKKELVEVRILEHQGVQLRKSTHGELFDRMKAIQEKVQQQGADSYLKNAL